MNTIGYDNWKLQESPSNESETIDFDSVTFFEDGEELTAIVWGTTDIDVDYDKLYDILESNEDGILCLDENKVINYTYNNL